MVRIAALFYAYEHWQGLLLRLHWYQTGLGRVQKVGSISITLRSVTSSWRRVIRIWQMQRHTVRRLLVTRWEDAKLHPPLTFANVQGYLVSIKDEKIGEFLYNKFKKKAWIGAKRYKYNKSQFLWSDNTPVEYTSWMSGEPNNVAKGCVINNFHQPKKWIDATCVLGPEVPDSNVPEGFFCEMDTAARGVKTDVSEFGSQESEGKKMVEVTTMTNDQVW